jgi:hypothetical protein
MHLGLGERATVCMSMNGSQSGRKVVSGAAPSFGYVGCGQWARG